MSEYYCEKCGKTMNENQFYTYKNQEKVELCKKCLTMHIDNFDPNTFLWLLEKMDVPYIPSEWNTLRDRAYAKDPNKMNGMSVFGKYLSKMKLKQWKEYGWADTERLQALEEEKRKTLIIHTEQAKEDLKEKYENGEISEAEYKTMTSVPLQAATQVPGVLIGSIGANNPFHEMGYMSQDELPDPSEDLTEDDKVYLAMKWGRVYTPREWIELEQGYEEMMNSFDIQDADTKNTLLFICKTKLKMNQALDSADIEGFQKLSKVYNDLRKSAKLTAAQNKEEKKDFVDCVGNLVAYCEKEGGAIPKYELKTDLDIIDTVINDLKQYTRDLIYEDKALASQIENYLKKREISEEQKRDKKEAKALGLEKLELKDQDYQDYYDAIEDDKEIDKDTLEGDDE
jgi:hypothetical protein